jgi:hypothetical protein
MQQSICSTMEPTLYSSIQELVVFMVRLVLFALIKLLANLNSDLLQHSTIIKELLFWFYGFLWYYSTCACTAQTAVLQWAARCQKCSCIVHVRELLHQAQPSLRLLILHGKVCGCTTTAVDGLWVAAAMCRDTTAYSSEMNGCVLGMPRPLCNVTTWLALLWLAGEQSMSQLWGKWLPVYCQSVRDRVT